MDYRLKPKPIFVIRLPRHTPIGKLDSIREMIANYDDLTNEYHVLAIIDSDLFTMKFECYNGDETTEEYKEVTRLTQISIQRCLNNEQNERESYE